MFIKTNKIHYWPHKPFGTIQGLLKPKKCLNNGHVSRECDLCIKDKKYQRYIIPMAFKNSWIEKCLSNSNIKPTIIVEYCSFTNFYSFNPSLSIYYAFDPNNRIGIMQHVKFTSCKEGNIVNLGLACYFHQLKHKTSWMCSTNSMNK